MSPEAAARKARLWVIARPLSQARWEIGAQAPSVETTPTMTAARTRLRDKLVRFCMDAPVDDVYKVGHNGGQRKRLCGSIRITGRFAGLDQQLESNRRVI